MKAKLLRPMVGAYSHTDLIRRGISGNYQFPEPPQQNEHGDWIWPAGTTIDHWQAFRLVQQGVAVPADDECEKAARRNPEQMAAAQAAYERLSRGIHPEDFDKYDRGEIAGYAPDGSYLPGPNATTLDDDEDDDYDHDSE